MTQQEQMREFEQIIKNTDPVALAVAWGQFVDMVRLYPAQNKPKLKLVVSAKR